MKKSLLTFCAGLLLATGMASASPLQEEAAKPLSLTPIYAAEHAQAPEKFLDDRWHLTLGIPLWVPGMDGNVSILGREISPDQGAGETSSSALEGRLNFAFAGHFELRKNRFTLFGDLMYVDVRAQDGEDRVDAELSLRSFHAELGAAYTLIAPEKRGFGALQLDLIGGVRVSGFRIGIDTNDFGGAVNHTTYDPFVGVRGEFDLLEWLAIKGRFDVGGFGIEMFPTSDIAYNLETGLEFRVARWCDITVGYRWLKHKFSHEPELIQFNSTLSGPFISLDFNF